MSLVMKYRIVAKHSSMCLVLLSNDNDDDDDDDGDNGRSKLVQQTVCPGNDSQLWTIELPTPTPNKNGAIIRHWRTGQDLLLGNNGSSGEVALSEISEHPLHYTISNPIITNNKVLDVNFASLRDGESVIWWRPTGKLNQCWSFVLDPIASSSNNINNCLFKYSNGLEELDPNVPALDGLWSPPTTTSDKNQELRPASNRWGEGQKRRATVSFKVKYANGVATVCRGQIFYVDKAGRTLVGWHGTVSPPCGMDGEPMFEKE